MSLTFSPDSSFGCTIWSFEDAFSILLAVLPLAGVAASIRVGVGSETVLFVV
jgi:hypothetical protein